MPEKTNTNQSFRWNKTIHFSDELRDFKDMAPHLPFSRLVRRAAARWMDCQGSYSGIFGKDDLEKLGRVATEEDFYFLTEDETWEALKLICEEASVDYSMAKENIHTPWALFLEMDRIEAEFVRLYFKDVELTEKKS